MLGETALKPSPTVVSTLNTLANSDEAGELAAVFDAVLRDLPYYNERAKVGELKKYTSSKLLESARADPESVLVAKIDGCLAGFLFNHVDDETIWLSWFGVLTNYRQQGVGRALLRALERRARKIGVPKIWCDSRTDNEKSKSILLHHGYAQACTLLTHWYGQDFFLWEKRVS